MLISSKYKFKPALVKTCEHLIYEEIDFSVKDMTLFVEIENEDLIGWIEAGSELEDFTHGS